MQKPFPSLPKPFLILTLAVSLLFMMAACQPSPSASPARSRPSWYIQISGTVDMNQPALIYDIDGFENTAATVSALHAKSKIVVCYVDLGSIENYRADYANFAQSALSNVNPEWPDEKWLDILRLDVAGPTGKTARQLLDARLDMCKSKGFDAVDPDMVELYAASGVTFSPAQRKVTYADQLVFNEWIASETHARGMAAGLKGDVDQAKDLQPFFDFSVNEQCHQYNECGELSSFITAGKSVLNIEYSGTNTRFTNKTCPEADTEGFYSVKKKLPLNAWTLDCPS